MNSEIDDADAIDTCACVKRVATRKWNRRPAASTFAAEAGKRQTTDDAAVDVDCVSSSGVA